MFLKILAFIVWLVVVIIAALMIGAALRWCDRPAAKLPHPMPSGSLPRRRCF